MAEYRNDVVYQTLERIIKAAGVSITYRRVHDDPIDGAIWARSDIDAMAIMMPDTDEFPDAVKAGLILGHEMGHIITGVDSPDDPSQRAINEHTCDLVGAYLYKLAEMTAGYEAEAIFRE